MHQPAGSNREIAKARRELNYQLISAASTGGVVSIPCWYLQPWQRYLEIRMPRPKPPIVLPDEALPAWTRIEEMLVFELLRIDEYEPVQARLIRGHESFERHWVGAVLTHAQRKPPGWWLSGYYPDGPATLRQVCGIVDAPPGSAWAFAEYLFEHPGAVKRFEDKKPRDWRPPCDELPGPVNLAHSRPDEWRVG